MKRAACLLMTVLLGVSLSMSAVGCGKKNKASDGKNPGKTTDLDLSNLNEPGTLPVLKEKVPLTILVATDTNIKDFKTNDYTKKLEKDVNVDLTFEYLPAGKEADQKLSVMISSNTKLPDVICKGLDYVSVYTYGSQGYFLPIDNLIDKAGNYLKKYLDSEAGKKAVKFIRSSDGKTYAFPRICEEIGNDFSRRMWINKTWLNKLGLKMPKTTDEYYEVLKAFRDKDPNGNGKKDEIPLVGSTTGWNAGVWPTIMDAFTYTNVPFDYLQKGKDGKITVSYIQPEFKDGLEYLHKLCEEKLLSPLTFTQDVNQFKQIIEDKNAQLLGSTCCGSMSVYQVKSERKKDMTHLPPLTGPKGVCYSDYGATSIPGYAGFITKDCRDTVAATAMFDYMYSYDMSMQGRWGTKDVDWKDPDKGAIGMYESLGWKPTMQYINSIWGTLQNSHWSENHPTMRTYEMSGGQVWNRDPYDSQYMTAVAVKDYMNKYPKDAVLRVLYTKEEADQIAEIRASLGTYRDEAVAAFITGTRPLSDWNTFISELKGIGLDEYLKITQKAYDRMQSMK